MKKLFLCIGLWGMFSSALFSNPFYAFPTTSGISNEQKTNNEEALELHGALAMGKLRSFIQPLELNVHSSFLQIRYLIKLSNISVEIQNESGQSLFSDMLSPAAGEQSFVNTGSWGNGSYIIYFTDDQGGRLYGEFTVSR